jgi:iron(III) transport system ATP-binding protein
VNDTQISASRRALEVSGVAKSFGSTRALIDVELDVADGELLALVGPSGCGKSTLLRVVAGLAAADRGEVRIGGRLVEDGSRRADPEQRDVGLVFQEHALFPHLTVSQNIMFGLRALSRPERQRRADHWLATIGLPGTRDRYPHELSGGERQRVALARALAPQPRLMLLDEPFASLDPNLRSHIRADVVHLLHETGTAAVFVTHDQSEALAIGDRIAVIRAGRIEQLGTPVDVFHHPANRFVAGFMGEARFLVIEPATNMTELGPAGLRRQESTPGLLVVRPSDVQIHCKEAPPYAVQAKVIETEFHGATRVYELSLPSGALVRSEQPYDIELHLGDTVYVSLTTGHHASVADTD